MEPTKESETNWLMTRREALMLCGAALGAAFTPKHSYQPAVTYHIGGRIAEVVTGEVWNKLFDKRLRIPLEMATFTYGETRNPRIGGGAKCALQDYGNLLQMHLAGGVFRLPDREAGHSLGGRKPGRYQEIQC